jgi:hypothetical protein
MLELGYGIQLAPPVSLIYMLRLIVTLPVSSFLKADMLSAARSFYSLATNADHASLPFPWPATRGLGANV